MIKAILRTLITLGILAWLLPTVSFLNWTTILLAAVILTLLFSVVRPILKLLFLPINIVTLGLFSAVINVFLLWIATYLVPGFQVREMALLGVDLNQFFSLLVVAVLIGFIQSGLKTLFR